MKLTIGDRIRYQGRAGIITNIQPVESLSDFGTPRMVHVATIARLYLYETDSEKAEIVVADVREIEKEDA